MVFGHVKKSHYYYYVHSICEWCRITIIWLYGQHRQICETSAETMLLLFVRLSGNLWPQILNFDVSPNIHFEKTSKIKLIFLNDF